VNEYLGALMLKTCEEVVVCKRMVNWSTATTFS
jgi:hypothetical protein